MTIIDTRGLIKTFKTSRGVVEAVRGIDLQVREGDIFGFLGPNGAGKTTTMRLLATLLEPTGGQARICGYDLRREAARIRARIGYVSQIGGAEAKETARENLILQGRLYGMSRAAAAARANDMIEMLDLRQFAGRFVQTYSGGQRRRLDLAMGLMHRPLLLFLDEPTAGLDPQSRARVWDEVRHLRAGGTTVFLTTHYMDEADALCDRLAIIDGGRLVREDTPDALKRQIGGDVISLGLEMPGRTATPVNALLRAQPFVRGVREVDGGLHLYVTHGEAALPAVMRLLDQSGTPLRTVSLARPTLDDVFLRLTGRSLREPGGTTA
jgi:ABC-2 type transport system ATP-binding protein